MCSKMLANVYLGTIIQLIHLMLVSLFNTVPLSSKYTKGKCLQILMFTTFINASRVFRI